MREPKAPRSRARGVQEAARPLPAWRESRASMAFDRSGKQYFADLYALACLRTATTADGGRTVYQSVLLTAGCADLPGADRQWLAVYDPAPGTTTTSAYTGPTPLIYLAYNNITSG